MSAGKTHTVGLVWPFYLCNYFHNANGTYKECEQQQYFDVIVPSNE